MGNRDLGSRAGGGEWIPDACTLPTAQRPLRTAEFDELLAGALGVERVAGDRLRLRLRPETAGRAAELAVREVACCSFFTFTLTAATGGLTLEARVPPAYAEVLDQLAARAANPADSADPADPADPVSQANAADPARTGER
jgi:hypothetical protein